MITFSPLGNSGRLGNQLWQIAATLGIADKLGEEVNFPRWSYEDLFCIPKELFVDATHGTEAHETHLVTHIDPRARIYLQDYNLWKDIKDKVIDWFQPSEHAENLLADIKQARPLLYLPRPLLSVHVRRGDNVTNPPGIHPLRPTDYYYTAMSQFEYASTAFFSDDPKWTQDKFYDDGDFFFHGTPRPKEHEPEYATAPVLDWIDLQLMTKCDFHILSNSTYSYWAAMIARSQGVVYPAPWFGKKLPYINAALMFPEDWIEINHG